MSRPDFDVLEEYLGDGVSVDYTFDFKITDLSQLLIIETDDDGVETQRVRGDDTTYLDGVEFDAINGGGTVTLADPLTSEYQLFIFLADDEPTQDYEFSDKGGFTLRLFEYALDKIMGAVQRLTWRSSRALRLHDTYIADFDPQLPVALDIDSTLIVGPDGLSMVLGPTAAELLQSGVDATSAATSATASATSATASAASAAAGVISAAAASASATASAASAAAAAVSAAVAAGAGSFISSGPFTVLNNASSALAAELFSSAVYTQIDYVARVVRGTTVFARCEFSILFRNSAWEVQLGNERGINPSGITWTVDATTGQVTAAADNGAGNATINLQKIYWAA